MAKHTKTKGLREREGQWHYRFQLAKREYSGNTGLAATQQNTKAALKICEAARSKAMQGVQQQTDAVRFPEAAGEFLAWCEMVQYRSRPATAKRIKGSLGSMVMFWQDRAVESLTPGDLEAYKLMRISEHRVKDVTLRHDLHNFSLFAKFARKNDWLDSDPLHEVSIPSDIDAIRMFVLTEEQEDRYFAATKKGSNLHDVARIMIEQGCRPEEVMALEQSAVDLQKGKIQIRRGKTAAARRELKLTEASLAVLRRRMTSPGKWVFPSRRASAHVANLKTAHENTLKASGLRFVLYDLRHTWATRAAESGMDPYTLAAILGHAGLRCIMKYVHVRREQMDRGMERMEASRMRKKIVRVG